MDSIDLVELAMAAESDLGITLAEGEHERLRDATATALWRLVVRARTGAEPGEDELPREEDAHWRQVRGWLALHLDVPVASVTAATPLRAP